MQSCHGHRRFGFRDRGRRDHWGNKTVALSGNGLNEAGLLGVVFESLTDLADGAVDAVVGIEENPFSQILSTMSSRLTTWPLWLSKIDRLRAGYVPVSRHDRRAKACKRENRIRNRLRILQTRIAGLF